PQKTVARCFTGAAEPQKTVARGFTGSAEPQKTVARGFAGGAERTVSVAKEVVVMRKAAVLATLGAGVTGAIP
ncbi:MAG: hypothetical protein KDL87_13860, partial [Verrucomicrobiae bacterium]|nr:hypothetical protein [Verrucomicrobiae bacterium]